MIYDLHILVCTNQRSSGDKRSCGETHGLELVAEFKKRLKELAPGVNTRANRAGCLGICDFGPTVAVYPDGAFYVGVEADDVEEIIRAHLFEKKPVERLLLQRHPAGNSLTALPSGELFESFKAQLAKDLTDAGLAAGFVPDIGPEWVKLKSILAEVISGASDDQAKLGRLLNRVDISEGQLKKYADRPGARFQDVLSELVIKRVLQKVVLRKKFSS
jgi:(2Fe-2S) ferredoxin